MAQNNETLMVLLIDNNYSFLISGHIDFGLLKCFIRALPTTVVGHNIGGNYTRYYLCPFCDIIILQHDIQTVDKYNITSYYKFITQVYRYNINMIYIVI